MREGNVLKRLLSERPIGGQCRHYNFLKERCDYPNVLIFSLPTFKLINMLDYMAMGAHRSLIFWLIPTSEKIRRNYEIKESNFVWLKIVKPNIFLKPCTHEIVSDKHLFQLGLGNLIPILYWYTLHQCSAHKF